MIKTNDVATFLNLPLHGDANLTIVGFSKIDVITPNTVVFAKKYRDDFMDLLNENPQVLAIVTEAYQDKLHCSYIVSENPRLDFIRILSKFFEPKISKGSIHPSAIIEEGALISPDAVIGPYCFVSSSSIIGSRTILHASVIVDNGAIIGDDCEIKSGVVLGQSGFGFERDKLGNPVKFPHFGKVVIGNNVYIGANTAIDRGTLGDTIIEDNVKIDNLVHIAHNCHIKEGSFVIACAILGGGTQIGKNCWIAPNVSVKEQTHINDGALVGLGAVVLKDVEENTVVVGNPAKKLNNKI